MSALLYRFDALRLVVPAHDDAFEAFFAVRATSLHSYNQVAALLAPTVVLCAAFLALRAAWAHTCLKRGWFR